jgi:hypothetical protein
MGAPGRVELPTNGLGNRCSIHLSYGAVRPASQLATPLSHAISRVESAAMAGSSCLEVHQIPSSMAFSRRL